MATKNPHGMTDRQWAFCRQYVKQGFTNATGAYQHAYPNCKSDHAAESHSSRLVKNGKVSAYLAEVKSRAAEKTQITAERVLAELGKLGFANMEDYVEWGPDGVTLKASEDLTPDMAAAVSEVSETIGEKGGSIKFKLHDKRGAIQIAKTTTISAVAAHRYLKGGLRESLIRALHDLALANNVPVGTLIDRFFSYDPIDGYVLRPEFRLDEKRLLEGEGTSEPVGIMNDEVEHP